MRIGETITPRTKAVFLTNPNNPTGMVIDSGGLETFVRSVAGRSLVVFDEAYAEFVEQLGASALGLVNAHPVVVLRSFSKARGLAGLRIGYGIASTEIIGLLEKRRRPDNVSALAQAAEILSLADRAYLEQTLERVSHGRRYLYGQFDALGLNSVQSETNFVFVHAGARAGTIVAHLRARGCYIHSNHGSDC